MDHYTQAKWLSEMEMNLGDHHPALIHDWPMIKNNNVVDWCSYISASRRIHTAYSCDSTNMISFGESNLNPRIAYYHDHQPNGKPNCNVKTEEPAEMIPLENTVNFSSPLISSEVSIEEIYGGMQCWESSSKSKRTGLQAEEHVLAERMRRKKLSRQFVDLSGVIPGLQKVDKSSILGGAIKYIKKLEEEKKRIYEESSAISSKRCRLPSSDDTSSSIENFDSITESSPKVDVKISGENVVFVINCKELQGILDEISGTAKMLHLRVITSCSMDLGNGKILITILSKMDDGFSSTAKDLANNIRIAILNLM